MIIDRPRLPIRQMVTIGLLPSPLKVAYYRWRGAKIGKGVSIGLAAVILADEAEIADGTTIGMGASIICAKLKIGKRTRIRPFVLINAQEVSIGNDVTISEVSLIRTMIPSAQSKFIVHDRVHIFPFTVIDPSRTVEIGEESCVGHGSSIYTHSSYKSKLDGYAVDFGEVHIGKGVWLSSNNFINQSVVIGDEAVVATGTVISRDVPAGALVVGAPVRVVNSKEFYVKQHTEEERLQIVVDIIDEFCQYLNDFAAYRWRRCADGTDPSWELTARNQREHYLIELSSNCSAPADGRLRVLLNEIPDEIRRTWDAEGRSWFSIGSHCCSEHLNSMGEELLEYFKRYGLYFARP